jgi:hypothetical protein
MSFSFVILYGGQYRGVPWYVGKSAVGFRFGVGGTVVGRKEGFVFGIFVGSGFGTRVGGVCGGVG